MNGAVSRAFGGALVGLGLTVALWAEAGSVAEIMAALRDHDYTQALDLTRARLKESPKDARLLTLEALALSSLKRNDEALRAFHSALVERPDYLPALEGAAQIEYKTGDPSAAALLDHILKLKPDEQTAHAMRGVIAWKQRDCATAVGHFEQSRDAIASEREALQEYAICLVRLERPADAVPVFRTLAESDPGNKAALYSLASTQLMARAWSDAIATLKPLTTGDHPDARALDLASAACEEMGDTPQAVATLHQAIVLEPRNAALYVDFAQLALTHKSYAVGVDMVNAGLRLLPDSARLYMARGVLEVQLARYDEADADFSRAEQLDPSQALGSTARGLAAAQQNNTDKALATVRSELAAHKSDPFLYYLLAEVLSSRGPQPGTPDFNEAVNAALKAIAMKPDFALARDILSRLYLQAGETGKAIEQCRLALASDPLDATAIYRLMRAVESTGHADPAEIDALLKRFTAVRDKLRQKEDEEIRYQLVEAGAPSAAH